MKLTGKQLRKIVNEEAARLREARVECDGCGKLRSDVQAMGRDANGDPDAPDLCFICRKEGERGRLYDPALGKYVSEYSDYGDMGEGKLREAYRDTVSTLVRDYAKYIVEEVSSIMLGRRAATRYEENLGDAVETAVRFEDVDWYASSIVDAVLASKELKDNLEFEAKQMVLKLMQQRADETRRTQVRYLIDKE